MAEFHQLMGSTEVPAPEGEGDEFTQFFNAAFTGDPLTAAEAAALHSTVVFSDFAPMKSGQFEAEHASGAASLHSSKARHPSEKLTFSVIYPSSPLPR